MFSKNIKKLNYKSSDLFEKPFSSSDLNKLKQIQKSNSNKVIFTCFLSLFIGVILGVVAFHQNIAGYFYTPEGKDIEFYKESLCLLNIISGFLVMAFGMLLAAFSLSIPLRKFIVNINIDDKPINGRIDFLDKSFINLDYVSKSNKTQKFYDNIIKERDLLHCEYTMILIENNISGIKEIFEDIDNLLNENKGMR